MTSNVTMPIVFARVVLENLNYNIHRANKGLSWSEILRESLSDVNITKGQLLDKCSSERWPEGWFETEEDEMDESQYNEECDVPTYMKTEVLDYLTGLEEQGILESRYNGNRGGTYRFSKQLVNMMEDLDELQQYLSELCDEDQNPLYNKMSSYYFKDAYAQREGKMEKETKPNKDRALA